MYQIWVLRCMMTKLAKHNSQNEFSFSATDSKRNPIFNHSERKKPDRNPSIYPSIHIRLYINGVLTGNGGLICRLMEKLWATRMTRIGVSAGFSSSSLPPPARRSRRKLWTCPYRPGGLRRRAAHLRSSPPLPAGSLYYCIQQHKSDRTNSGRQRRGGRRATYEAPANREEPSYSYFAGC